MTAEQDPLGSPLRSGGELRRGDQAPSAPADVVALLTPRGRGAVASLRMIGSPELIDRAQPPLFVAANGKPVAAQPMNRILYGRWGDAPGEDVVLCRVDETTLEIHCHGGETACRTILSDLERHGCRIVESRNLDLTSSLLEIECRHALTKAPTLRAAGILLEQQSALRSALESMLSDLERGEFLSAHRRVAALRDWTSFGRHLTEPWQIVILGRPNVGKSSLLNALAGFERAIVFNEPGTTRDLVTAEIALQGWPVRIVDTAGIRKTESPLESSGIGLARDCARQADLRLLVIDTSQPPGLEDVDLLAAWPDALVVANKSDLPDAWGEQCPAGAHRTSAATGAGIEELTDRVANQLVPRVPPPDTAIPVAQRHSTLVERLDAACGAGEWHVCARLIREMLT